MYRLSRNRTCSRRRRSEPPSLLRAELHAHVAPAGFGDQHTGCGRLNEKLPGTGPNDLDGDEIFGDEDVGMGLRGGHRRTQGDVGGDGGAAVELEDVRFGAVVRRTGVGDLSRFAGYGFGGVAPEDETREADRQHQGKEAGDQLQGVSRSIIRGNGMVSRTWCRPQIQATVRSTPRPNPACGTLQYLRRSRYHWNASGGRSCVSIPAFRVA